MTVVKGIFPPVQPGIFQGNPLDESFARAYQKLAALEPFAKGAAIINNGSQIFYSNLGLWVVEYQYSLHGPGAPHGLPVLITRLFSAVPETTNVAPRSFAAPPEPPPKWEPLVVHEVVSPEALARLFEIEAARQLKRWQAECRGRFRGLDQGMIFVFEEPFAARLPQSAPDAVGERTAAVFLKPIHPWEWDEWDCDY